MHEPIGESYPNGLWELGCSYCARGATKQSHPSSRFQTNDGTGLELAAAET